ncbi:hypothetical protein ACFZBP_09785 [Streptomyces sp. NPDC008086]|uniref:hypothetical protein n=1 Tax=Streptomyces sp. NPDC008086 TaxID=3364807 RepID=UPI0036DFCCF1
MIIGLVLYGMAAKTPYDRAILRRRGISVPATFHRHAGKRRMFRFTDLDGVPRDREIDTAAQAPADPGAVPGAPAEYS